MRWPWSRRETRSAGNGYTALSLAARADAITGRRGAAEATAAVEACVRLWENGLSVADVTGASLPPATLAMIGRALALRGEFVALIGGDGDLIPAADYDVSTTDGRPRAYRMTLPDVGGGRTLTALAGEVVHVVTGADVREPWRGVSPLRRASLSADLLATVEAALVEVYDNAPLGSVVNPVPEMTAADSATLAASFRGQRGRVLLRESVSTTAAGGPVPQADWRPHGLTPELDKSLLIEAGAVARDSVCAAFGVDPSLLSSVASGPGLREAQRHLATWHLQPAAGLIAAELSAKFGAPVALDVMRPLQAFDAGGRARAFGAMIRGIAEAKAAGLSPAEVEGALRLVDWQSE